MKARLGPDPRAFKPFKQKIPIVVNISIIGTIWNEPFLLYLKVGHH